MVDWSDDQQCRSRRRAHAWVETVGAGAGKSGCFFDVLRWSVGRHGASDLDAHSFGRQGHIRQSVLRRIASGAAAVDVGNGMPGDSLWIHW